MKLNKDKYKAFFFDFDGVIVDSLKIKGEAFGSLFTEYGQEIVQKVVDYHFNNGGVSRYDKFKYYYNELLNKDITQEIIDGLNKQYSEKVVKKVVAASAIEGVMNFIKQLNNIGKRCFIVSATPEKEIRQIVSLRGMEEMFKEIVGSPRKKSDNLKYLLEKYSIPAREALYFGDAMSDYRAAQNNNVDFIAVVSEDNLELVNLEGITKIKNFKELIDLG